MQANSILIVEDEAIVALDLKLQLQGLGYEVLGIAASGAHALALVARRAPNLILMDVRLQGPIDGIEVAEEIRRDHDLPVIFLTSHSDNDTVRRAARTAPYGYLTKPYQAKELRAGIEVALTKYRMERQLREADRWFAHTLQCVADGVIVTDLEARVRFVNPAAERLTGWGIDEAVGQSVSDVVRFRAPAGGAESVHDAAAQPPRPGSDEVVRSVLRGGRPVSVAHALGLLSRHGADKLVDETAGPVNDEDGNRLGAVLVLRDATERVAQEALLRASEERFRRAFDHAPLGMALVSMAGDYIQVNEALCRLLGASADALRHQGQRSLTLEADREHEVQRLHELMTAPGNVVQFERHYCRLDGGEPVPTLVSVSLMVEGGRPTCYLYQVNDLTEQKRAAGQLAELAAERMRREASDLANAAKSEFLSRVSHEMRTPLNAVVGFAQLLAMKPDADPRTTETYAQLIKTAGEHLLLLVTDLMDLNRAAQGTLKMSPQPLGLAHSVQEALRLLESQSQLHGIVIEVSVASTVVVNVDPMRLRQVLLNVVSNAIKYNRPGGTVHLRSCSVGDRVRLSIEDGGVGMTLDQLERLFQPFDRLGQERSKIPGIGLGLVIARSLVAEMGGNLDVASRPREGTTVTIDLPRATGGQA